MDVIMGEKPTQPGIKSFKTVQKVYKIIKLQDQKGDFEYWQSQPYQARLAALEQIRQEYHRWRNDAQPGFQRVYTIVKLKTKKTP
jgi:hypothetical protein